MAMEPGSRRLWITVSGARGATHARVAVVVPAYQCEQYIAETLRSIQDQTHQDWECIVIDDGSTDGTAGIVRAFADSDPRVRLVRQVNRGLPAARNTGIRNVSPGVEFVSFVDADDTLCGDALSTLVSRLTENGDAVGSYGYAELMDEDGRPMDPGFHPARQKDRWRIEGWVNRRVSELEPVEFAEWVVVGPLWPPAVGLHRRDVVDAVGGFDEDLKQVEDTDFYIRMSRFGPYLPVGRQVAWYRQHRGQMTTRRAEFWHSHDRVRHKAWISAQNTPDQRRAVERAWRISQLRRITRCTQRLVAATSRREWRAAGRLLLGLSILLGQGLRGRPPEARWRHVVWTGRDV
jgi:glycosyltransferase involved in cell wall biosynthesis